MANRFLVAGGTGNWNSTTNWAATSGGSSGASFPVAGDVVAFDSLSGNANMTVNVASACASLIMSGTYAGTLTFNDTLTLTSTCTFVSTCTIAGTAGTLILSGTSTATSGGKTLTCALTVSGTPTITLGDNWTVNGLLTYTAGGTVNTNKIVAAGGWHLTTGTSGGTATIELTGGTLDSAAGSNGNNVTFNGNVTVSGAISLMNTTGRTLKYLSGTVTTTGSTITCNATSTTYDTNGITWNNFVVGSGQTASLTSNFACSGTLTITNTAGITFSGAGAINMTGAVAFASGGTATVTFSNTGGLTTTGTMSLPNGSMTFAGSAGFTVGTLTTATLTASRTYTLTQGNTYSVTAALTNVGTTTTIRQAIISSSAGNKVVFNLTPGASCNLRYCDPTDVNSNGGATVLSLDGVITTSLNWNNSFVTATGPGGGRILSSSIIQGQGA